MFTQLFSKNSSSPANPSSSAPAQKARKTSKPLTVMEQLLQQLSSAQTADDCKQIFLDEKYSRLKDDEKITFILEMLLHCAKNDINFESDSSFLLKQLQPIAFMEPLYSGLSKFLKNNFPYSEETIINEEQARLCAIALGTLTRSITENQRTRLHEFHSPAALKMFLCLAQSGATEQSYLTFLDFIVPSEAKRELNPEDFSFFLELQARHPKQLSHTFRNFLRQKEEQDSTIKFLMHCENQETLETCLETLYPLPNYREQRQNILLDYMQKQEEYQPTVTESRQNAALTIIPELEQYLESLKKINREITVSDLKEILQRPNIKDNRKLYLDIILEMHLVNYKVGSDKQLFHICHSNPSVLDFFKKKLQDFNFEEVYSALCEFCTRHQIDINVSETPAISTLFHLFSLYLRDKNDRYESFIFNGINNNDPLASLLLRFTSFRSPPEFSKEQYSTILQNILNNLPKRNDLFIEYIRDHITALCDELFESYNGNDANEDTVNLQLNILLHCSGNNAMIDPNNAWEILHFIVKKCPLSEQQQELSKALLPLIKSRYAFDKSASTSRDDSWKNTETTFIELAAKHPGDVSIEFLHNLSSSPTIYKNFENRFLFHCGQNGTLEAGIQRLNWYYTSRERAQIKIENSSVIQIENLYNLLSKERERLERKRPQTNIPVKLSQKIAAITAIQNYLENNKLLLYTDLKEKQEIFKQAVVVLGYHRSSFWQVGDAAGLKNFKAAFGEAIQNEVKPSDEEAQQIRTYYFK